ncbi:DUF859 family phage minor structural protein [Streptococcus sp. A23]|uniref:DUF859 family phage minor structural protein n=1 Tax=Streptococcus sp. A23 TaxID=3373127 RepID=UPI00374CECA4
MYEKVSVYNTYKTVVIVDEVSQNRNNNTTTVRVRAHLVPSTQKGTLAQWSNNRSPSSSMPTKCTLVVDGVDYVWNIPDGYAYSHYNYWIQQNPTGLLIDKTLTFVHDAQGSRSIPIKLLLNGTNFYHDGIAETHRITSITQTSTETISGNVIGNPVSIAISRSTEALTHKIYWSFGTLSGTISENATTSATWTPTLAQLAPQIPNSSSGIARIRVESYVNGTKNGERTYEHNLYLPSTVKPTLTGLTLTDGNDKAKALNLGANTFVQAQSNIRPRFVGANGIYGSQIVSYRAEIQHWVNNQWQATTLSTTANNGLTGNANFSGRAKVVAYVTDSRGRQSDRREVEINYLPYHVPAISFRGERTGADDVKINVIRNLKIAPLTVGTMQKNTARLSFDVVDVQTNQRTNNVGGSANWTGATEHEKINWTATLDGTYDAGKTYLVIGKLSDAFHTSTFEYRVGVQAVPVSISKHGLAVGKEWTRGVLDVGNGSLPAYFDCDIIMHGMMVGHYGSKHTNDFNTTAVAGFYNFSGQPNGRPPQETGTIWGVLEVINSHRMDETNPTNSASWVYQICRTTTQKIYTRERINRGNWSSWKQLATTDLIGSQKHKLSEDNGVAIQVTGDWNNVTTTGFYRGSGLANQPSKAGAHSWYYVRVTGHDAGRAWVLQEAVDFNGVGSWYRVKLNGAWQPWKEYALEKPAPTWVSTGVAGCDYKVNGSVVSLRITRFNTGYNAISNLGTIPSQYVPNANTTTDFIVPTSSKATTKVQIHSSGTIVCSEYNATITTQVTWQI